MADSEQHQQLTVGVVTESRPGERRVAMVPKLVGRLAQRGLRVLVEPGAGAGAYLSDDAFIQAGAELGDAWSAPVVVKVNPPAPGEVAKLGRGTVLIGFLDPRGNPEGLAKLEEAGLRAFAMEAVPRISRAQAMDALSSQASIGGYRAVLLAARKLPRFFPMLTTAALHRAPGEGAGARQPASPGCRHWPRRSASARRPPVTTSGPRSASRSSRSARSSSTSASKRSAKAATPAS